MFERRFLALLFFLLMLVNAGIFAQSYDLQFRIDQDDGVVSGIFEVTVQARASGAPFNLGSSNLVFTYNTASIASPPAIVPGEDPLQIQAIHNFSGVEYNTMTLTEPSPGRLSLNIELLLINSGTTLLPAFMDIATIRFTIVDPNQPENLSWRSVSPNAVTLFENNELNMATAGTLYGPATLANLKIFLEGAYSGGTMTTSLNSGGYIPLKQPYGSAPWNYSGTDTVSAIPANVVDWVLVELRSDATTTVASRAAFLKNDGSIVDLNGSSPVTFNVAAGNYYVVVYHRNHLAIMSAATTGMDEVIAPAEVYDFTTAQTQAYGTNPMAEVEPGVFGFYKGDANGSGTVNATDYLAVKNVIAGVGYYTADCNLSTTVNATDYLVIKPNAGQVSQVPAAVNRPIIKTRDSDTQIRGGEMQRTKPVLTRPGTLKKSSKSHIPANPREKRKQRKRNSR